MSGRLTIVSGGTGLNTHVLDACGDPVKWGGACLKKIEILPIMPNGVVSAVLHLDMVGLHLDVEGIPFYDRSGADDEAVTSGQTGDVTVVINAQTPLSKQALDDLHQQFAAWQVQNVYVNGFEAGTSGKTAAGSADGPEDERQQGRNGDNVGRPETESMVSLEKQLADMHTQAVRMVLPKGSITDQDYAGGARGWDVAGSEDSYTSSTTLVNSVNSASIQANEVSAAVVVNLYDSEQERIRNLAGAEGYHAFLKAFRAAPDGGA